MATPETIHANHPLLSALSDSLSMTLGPHRTGAVIVAQGSSLRYPSCHSGCCLWVYLTH